MKKVNKILSVLLSLIMIFSVIPMTSITASAATQAEAVSWANAQIGKYIDYDGVYGPQCVDLTKAYYAYLGVTPAIAYGYEYATVSLPSGWSRIAYYSGFVPQPGDIAVWTYSTSAYGHVAIITSATASSMNVVEQNNSTGVRAHTYRYSYGTFYGVIRPNFTGGTSTAYNYQTITAGSYYIKSNGQSTYNYLTVSETSPNSGAGVNTWSFMAVSRVQIDNNGGNFYTMKFPDITTANAVNVHTDSTYPTATTKVTNYKYSGSTTQSWGFDKVSDGYVIRCKANENMVLTCNGSGQATISAYSAGNANQIWSLIPYVSGTVQYNANGGSGAPSPQTKYFNQTLTLSSTKPTRTGYTFLGWSTSSTATSATYSAGGNFTTDANTTLYAVWKANTYTVSYNANGGSGAPSNQTKTHGKALTLSSTKPTRTGYTFLGWSPSSTATTATYSAGGNFTLNANVTLYAVWKQSTTELTVNSSNNAVISNGGDVAYYTFTPSSNSRYVIYSTGDTDTRVFLYDSSGTMLASDDDSGESNNFRLEYNLTAGTTYRYGIKYYNSTTTGTIPFKFNIMYTVTYDANGGTGAPETQYKEYGINLILSDIEPVREGYVFEGWALIPNALVIDFKPGAAYCYDWDASLYAIWSELPQTPSDDDQGVEDDPCADGHDFLYGFCSDCGASGTIESSHPYDNNADETYIIYKENVTAIWVKFSDNTYVEDGYDFIEIYDKDDNLIGRYTGDELASQSIQVVGDTVKIRLVSDDSNTAYGFRTHDMGYMIIPNTDSSEKNDYAFYIQEPSRTTIRNKDTIILHAVIDGYAPEGSYVEWEGEGYFSFGWDIGNDYDMYATAEDKGYDTITAILYDANGNELDRDSVELYSKSGFFDKIGGFFRSLFGTDKLYEY